MGNLTTESLYAEFQRDLSEQAYRFEQMAGEFETHHRKAAPGFSYSSQHGATETPDRYTLFVGFTMLISQMSQIVNMIGELEEIASCDDDEMEDSEIYHTYGELFALKEMYLRTRRNMLTLEHKRVEATAAGINPRHFMRLILIGDGIPTIPDPNAFAMGGMLSSGRLRANDIDASVISALMPSVSATPPPIPVLLP